MRHRPQPDSQRQLKSDKWFLSIMPMIIKYIILWIDEYEITDIHLI